MSSPQPPSPPPAPNYGQLFQEGAQTEFKWRPKFAQQEYDLRAQFDPQYIQHQQDLQAQFGPRQYAQMLAAFNQVDPSISQGRNQLFNYFSNQMQHPQNLDAYNSMHDNLLSQYNLGTQLDPGTMREVEQEIARRQASTGNAYGGAADIASAYSVGTRGLQLQQQRLNNLEGFYNLTSPQARAAAGMESYLAMPNMAQMVTALPPVMADRAAQYINPNAGAQGVQFGLQNYQNQLAATYAGYQPNSNPWMGAVGGILGGAVGGYFGGPMGAQAGSSIGGSAGNYLGTLF